MPTLILQPDRYISPAERAFKDCEVWVAMGASTIAKFAMVHRMAMWAHKTLTHITRFEFENEMLLVDKR